MLVDYFFIAVNNLFKRKLRSWLTVIGIFIGIMSVVALVSLSQGMQNAILSEFKKMGTNRIVIAPGGAGYGPVGGFVSSAKFTANDYDAVKNIRGVDLAITTFSNSAYVTFGKQTKQQLIWGFPVDSKSLSFYKDQTSFELSEGRFLRPGDRYKVVIGSGIANDTFDKDIHVGDSVMINLQQFQVIGVQKKSGGFEGDRNIRIPIDTAREIFSEPKEVTAIFMNVKDGYSVDDVAESAKRKLRKERNVKEGEEDFTVQTSAQTIATIKAILGVIQAVLVGIAAISLLVGGIGIMNTMYTSVVERTREIGIMKSVGARNSSILIIFLIESGLLGLLGGIIGVLAGLGLSKIAEVVAFRYGVESLQAYMGAPLIIGALAFAFIIGSVSGTLPARQASMLSPVDALRK
jgi:putative ABC transport system permease protein